MKTLSVISENKDILSYIHYDNAESVEDINSPEKDYLHVLLVEAARHTERGRSKLLEASSPCFVLGLFILI